MAKRNINADMGGAIKQSFDQDSYALRTVAASSLIKFDFDYYSVAYPSATQEVYTYKRGGASGTIVGTITINYTDGTKQYVSNATVVEP
jgi:hypothetical protein